MGLPGFGDKTADGAPGGTIQNNWWPMEHPNYTGRTLSPNSLGGTYTNRWHEEKSWPKSGYEGKYSSGRVPIGAWASIHDGECNSKQIDHIGWGFGDWSGGDFPHRLDDTIATDCAKTGNSTRSHKESNDRDNRTTGCWIGRRHAKGEDDEENCVKSGVQWPVFCQLGDYVGTQSKCKSDCGNTSSNSGNTNTPCNFALDRLCGKTKEDNVKKNGNFYIKADRNWITDDVCKSYCGNPNERGSTLCQSNKSKYCKTKSQWPEAGEYCYDFWKNNPNMNDMNDTCKDKLMNASSPENILTDVGCGYLCRPGSNVDDGWCKDRMTDFCTANNNNMATTECFNHCKDYPEDCELYLEKNFCKNKGNKLDFEVGDTGKKFSDWCGCLMGTQFYEDYRDTVFKQFEDNGYSVEDISGMNTDPICMYPKCAAGSIVRSDQLRDKKDCGVSCVNIMLNNFDESSVGGDYYAEQSANCRNKEITKITVDGETNVDIIHNDGGDEPEEETSEEERQFTYEESNWLGLSTGEKEIEDLTQDDLNNIRNDNILYTVLIIIGGILFLTGCIFLGIFIRNKFKKPEGGFGRRC